MLLSIDLEPMIEEFYSDNPQLQPSLAILQFNGLEGEGKISLFDGRYIRLQADHNNNKIERFNGKVRDREKVMRGLKKIDTPILTSYQIYHNYMQPHEGLNNITPTEACGIKVEGRNKWITLIQNAVVNEGSTII